MKQFAFALEFLNSILNANYCLDTTFSDGFCMAINLFANHYPLEGRLVLAFRCWFSAGRMGLTDVFFQGKRKHDADEFQLGLLWLLEICCGALMVSWQMLLSPFRRLPAFLPVPPSRDLPCPLPPFCLPAWWRFGGCVRPLSLLASLHLSRSIGVLLKLVQFFTTHLRKCCLHT